jgi:pimeloyl-ACP methyl ester carboxylesterase
MTHPTAVTGYAPVSGTGIYWESRGDGGTPLIVVHGGFGLASMFGDLLGQLAAARQVIAIELPGHGHTRDHGRPFTWEGFGDDIAGVIEHLGLGQADLLGHSLGGAASLRAAIQYPGRVRRLAVVSAPCRRDGWFPGVRAGMDQIGPALFDQLKLSPMYQGYCEVAPDPGAFPALISKTGDLLRRPFDWTDEVSQLRLPVLLAYGDADSIAPAHAAEFFARLGGGLADAGWDGSGMGSARLAILPGLTHYDIFTSPLLAATAAGFFA